MRRVQNISAQLIALLRRRTATAIWAATRLSCKQRHGTDNVYFNTLVIANKTPPPPPPPPIIYSRQSALSW